jgi:hypothetical protein
MENTACEARSPGCKPDHQGIVVVIHQLDRAWRQFSQLRQHFLGSRRNRGIVFAKNFSKCWRAVMDASVFAGGILSPTLAFFSTAWANCGIVVSRSRHCQNTLYVHS